MTKPTNRLTAVKIKASPPGPLLDQRRAVMLRWAEFITGQGAVVVQLNARSTI